MITPTPPEAADGGFWYVVEAVPDPEEGGLTPGEIPGQGWCAWYRTISGTAYAAVRTPEPVTGATSADGISVADVLTGHSRKPRGRVGGS